MKMTEMIERIKREHTFNPPLPETQIVRFEQHLEYKLPADLKAFYRMCDGATLFKDRFGWAYKIVPLAEVQRVTLDILGRKEDVNAPYTRSWYSVCDVQDGNYIAADLSSVKDSYCWFIDCFHETYDSGDVIALSFTEFLGQALNSRGEHCYWLNENFKTYGCLYGPGEQ